MLVFQYTHFTSACYMCRFTCKNILCTFNFGHFHNGTEWVLTKCDWWRKSTIKLDSVSWFSSLWYMYKWIFISACRTLCFLIEISHSANRKKRKNLLISCKRVHLYSHCISFHRENFILTNSLLSVMTHTYTISNAIPLNDAAISNKVNVDFRWMALWPAKCT